MYKKKKGQAAVEFLTTYGWAIMATLIAVGALYYFNVLDPNDFTTVKCETGPQLQCLEASIDTNGDINVRIRNNHNIEVALDVYVNVKDTGLQKIDSTQSILQGGEHTFTGNIAGVTLNVGDTVDIPIRIDFGRSSGSLIYKNYGKATLKVIP